MDDLFYSNRMGNGEAFKKEAEGKGVKFVVFVLTVTGTSKSK